MVLPSARGTPQETFVLFDAGPQGYLSLAAHGHADALSFTLNVGGKPVLVDPGTYGYHAESDGRAYFRGTRAHNTVTVDEQDQAMPDGMFTWLKRADAKVLEWNPERQTVVAEHDGYRNLRTGVIHRRKIALQGNRLELVDELHGTGEHQLEWRFHFAPECEVQRAAGLWQVVWNGGRMSMKLAPQITWSLIKGASDAGWISESLGVKRPAFSLCGALKATLPFRASAEIEIGGSQSVLI